MGTFPLPGPSAAREQHLDAVDRVLAAEANWEESRMARLAGKFAGVLRVSVDADRAEAAMREHLREILTSLPELAEQFPEFFERDLAPETSLDLMP